MRQREDVELFFLLIAVALLFFFTHDRIRQRQAATIYHQGTVRF